jgi:hypothetical protein
MKLRPRRQKNNVACTAEIRNAKKIGKPEDNM